VALLQSRRLPLLRELILTASPEYSRPIHAPFHTQWQLLVSLLTNTRHTRAPLRLLSTSVWTPWVPLFEISKLLSEGNESGIIPALILPSLPHPRILGPLVNSLNGELVTQMDHLPSWESEEDCHKKKMCYECHNGGWVCTDLRRCQRGRRNEPATITRYTLSN